MHICTNIGELKQLWSQQGHNIRFNVPNPFLHSWAYLDMFMSNNSYCSPMKHGLCLQQHVSKNVCEPHWNYQAGTQDRGSKWMCDSHESNKQILNLSRSEDYGIESWNTLRINNSGMTSHYRKKIQQWTNQQLWMNGPCSNQSSKNYKNQILWLLQKPDLLQKPLKTDCF